MGEQIPNVGQNSAPKHAVLLDDAGVVLSLPGEKIGNR
jgi:hypothetical protein